MSSLIDGDMLLVWITETFNHPVHFAAEVVLVLFILYLLTKRPHREQAPEDKLTLEEEEELIAEWNPEPLVKSEDHTPLPPVVQGPSDAHVTVDGKDFINLASNGILGLQNHKLVRQVAVETCKIFGVGSCGPRGFYGSLKPHNDFEVDIAKFMGTQGGVLFGSEFQAIATVLPAFLKDGDIAIIDKGVSFAIQNGLSLCRCRKKWFNHNDMTDLKLKLEELKKEFESKKSRIFFIGEGVYANTGDIIHLNEVMALKARYPFRIILEESFSVGALGKTGRGVTEHFGIEINQVEIIVASLGNALGGVGGFSVCDELLASHQRLNCTGYVFSCALPGFAAAGSSKSLELIDFELMNKLHSNVSDAIKILKTNQDLVLLSHPASSYIRLVLKEQNSEAREVVAKLKAIQQYCYDNGVLISTWEYQREQFPGIPCLRLSISAGLSLTELKQSLGVLQQATDKFCQSK